MQTFSLFISSPGDVNDERRRAELAIRKLQAEFDGYLRLEPIFWEHQPQSSHQHFQEQIKLPSETDLVVCILWARLGTRLPADKFHRPDGSPYLSGTEFEFEDAVAGYQRSQTTPDLWIYRKTAAVNTTLDAPDYAEKVQQKNLLERFLDHWLGNPHDGFKAGFNTFTDADDFQAQFTDHLRQTLQARCPQHATDTDALPPWNRAESPYRGLNYFDLDHAPLFFGRTAAVHAILTQLQQQAEAGQAFVLILGASGVGKSSLLRAGLLHALLVEQRVAAVDAWRYAILRPSDAGEDGELLPWLAQGLLSTLPELATIGLGEVSALTKQLAHPEDFAPLLTQALTVAAANVKRERRWLFTPCLRLVLVIDPLEEIFRYANAALLLALQALSRSGQVWVIAGMRNEFYPHIAGTLLAELKTGKGQYDLAAPDTAGLGDIIRLPARAAGLKFALRDGQRLDAQLLDAAAKHPNALPLLEFTLDRLYTLAQARHDSVLSFDDYDSFGGLEGAIATAADDVAKDLGAAHLDHIRDVFRQFVDWKAGKALRRRMPLASFTAKPEQAAIVERFIAARLLTSSDDSPDHTRMVEPVHEALLHTWQQWAQWINDDAEFHAIRARMEELAQSWQDAGCNVSYLLNSGKQEQDAKTLLQQPWLTLEEQPYRFIDLSLQRLQRQRRRRAMLIGTVTVSFISGAAGFSWVNYQERQKADTAADLALQVVSRLTYELPDRLRTLPGTLHILQETFEQNAELLQQIDALRGETAESAREKAVNLNRQGDQRQALGDLAGALSSYRASLATMEKLAAQDPTNTDQQRDLSVCHNKIGDIQSQQGDLPAALASYRASLVIREKLAAQDPANALWQRDLSVSHERIGGLQRQQGDLPAALASYRADLAIAEKLTAQDPANAQWQRDLSVSHQNIGDLQTQQGDLPAALASYRAALAIREKLAAQDPSNREWQGDLAFSHVKLGIILWQSQQTPEALAQFRAAVALLEPLVAKAPDHAQWRGALQKTKTYIAELEAQATKR